MDADWRQERDEMLKQADIGFELVKILRKFRQDRKIPKSKTLCVGVGNQFPVFMIPVVEKLTNVAISIIKE